MKNSEKTHKKTGIYKITNLMNNKVYIGQSTNIYKRWYDEKRLTSINKHLKNAFTKYGIDNFSFEILEECSEDELNIKEKEYIERFTSFDRECGYNKTTGGDTNFRQKTHTVSKETRAKISNSKKGIMFSEEHKKNLSIARNKRVITEQQKQKLSSSLKEIYKRETEEHKASRKKNISEAKKGMKFSEEHKLKLSEAAKHRKKPTKSKKVICLSTGKIYGSIIEAAIDTNSIASKISTVCKGKRKTTNNLVFAYLEK